MEILGSKTWTITRYAGDGTVVDLRRTEGSTSTFTIRGSVQPMRGEEIQLAGIENAEGRGMRSRRSLKVYTKTMLRTVEEVGQALADELTYKGEQYVIHATKEYDEEVLDHFKGIAVRRERSPAPP